MGKTKRTLGLDLGTNSIGWSIIEHSFEDKEGKIIGSGSRIIPMTQDVMDNFSNGVTNSQTAVRTGYRSARRRYQRTILRRERLHRILNLIGFLPHHYGEALDFERRLGQFKKGMEVKLSHSETLDKTKSEFIFMDSYQEMIKDFNTKGAKIPHDWTIYYLRHKAVSRKISKEELCWILLNFNQKRGYYQLRGDDLDEDKNKEYVVLKIKSVTDTEKEIKGKKQYQVIFENGWKYSKTIDNPAEWEGKTKEYIVTTTTLRDGNIKRSYKTVDSTADWAAIKAKTEQDIDKTGMTVGSYIYKSLKANPKQKIRGKLVKTIERKYYRKELTEILHHQAQYHSEFNDKQLYKKCIEHLYSKNEAHRHHIAKNDLIYLLIEDIIFYQRPLKTKQSTRSNCKYEIRRYAYLNPETNQTEHKEVSLKGTTKSHPLFQEFRLWQFVANIKVINSDLEFTDQENAELLSLNTVDERVALYEFLNEKKDVTESQFLKYLVKRKLIQKSDIETYRWNYDSESKYPCNSTRADLQTKLKKVEGLPTDYLNFNRELALWHIIYSVTDQAEFSVALKNYAIKNNLNQESFVEAFKTMPPYESSYSTLSLKAIKKLLPLMRMGKYWSEEAIDTHTKQRIEHIITGEVVDDKISDRVREKGNFIEDIKDCNGLPLWLSSYIVYGRHSESSSLQRWSSPTDLDNYLKEFRQHSLRNPIVEQVVTETLRVVRDLWTYYGKGEKGYFNAIHLELGREMKNSSEKRKRMSANMRGNQRSNELIRKILENLQESSTATNVRSYSPSHQEILKLYEEGVRQNPQVSYTSVGEDEIEKIRKSPSPTKEQVHKYKLWLEQGYQSPYTGQMIPLSKLFTTDYEIEHVIPRSRYFDDSLSNKIICESDINKDKGRMTAYEYMAKKDGDIVDGHKLMTAEQYTDHCQSYFKSNRTKLNNLLSEDIPEGFIERQMNDSRYIAKFVKGLLSNIVREEGEQEVTAKNLISIPGAITSQLKHDWGLNDKWNEIITPRFKRMNELTNSEDFGYFDQSINAFRIQVPSTIRQGFSKKRIDHRHHALDAITLACTTRDHINYLNSLNSKNDNYSLRSKLLQKNKKGDFTKHFQLPWKSFPADAKSSLEQIVISFKQNRRVINKTNNTTWQWIKKTDGTYEKRKVKQTKGDTWSIRKQLHKETVAGKLDYIDAPKGKIVSGVRKSISSISKQKDIDGIANQRIRHILSKHAERYTLSEGKIDYESAFSQDGIDHMNKTIHTLNDNKPHHPIYKATFYEIGKKFALGSSGNNSSKYVEAAKGTNLFFAIYWNETKQKRVYESIPLFEVVEHQKQVAKLPKDQRTEVPIKAEMGDFLFSLSPNDLVYVPNSDENNNSIIIDSINPNRIYKAVSFTGNRAFFIPNQSATSILNKKEFGVLNKFEKDNELNSIKDVCIKLKVDRIGNVTALVK